MATIRDVAKKANVSIATVSRILSEDATFSIKESTRNRVEQIASELGYVNNKKKPELEIGCLMSLTYKSNDPFFINILTGVQGYCTKHNAVIQLVLSYPQFQDMSKSFAQRIEKLDGLIVTDFPSDKIERLTELNSYITFIDHRVNGMCSVEFDNVYANEIMVQHLVDCGYRNIAYIGGPSDNFEFRYCTRLMVLRNTLQRFRISYDESMFLNCDWSDETCRRMTRDLIHSHPNIDCIIAGSDSLATVIISELSMLGVRCPLDIGVIGFNDNPISQNFQPPLTTVYLPARRMGELGAKLLIDQINSQTHYDYQIVLPVDLKVRSSTRKQY